MLRRNLVMGLAALAVMISGQHAHAGLTGSESFSSSITALNGSDLTATQYSFAVGAANPNALLVTNAAGIFSNVPTFSTMYSSSILNLANLGAFTLTNGTYGTFTGSSVGSYIIDQSATFLDVYIAGMYIGTPTGSVATPASLTFSFNTSGGVIGGGETLNIPPSVPEPASIAMLGLGLVGVAGYRFRRRAAK